MIVVAVTVAAFFVALIGCLVSGYNVADALGTAFKGAGIVALLGAVVAIADFFDGGRG